MRIDTLSALIPLLLLSAPGSALQLSRSQAILSGILAAASTAMNPTKAFGAPKRLRIAFNGGDNMLGRAVQLTFPAQAPGEEHITDSCPASHYLNMCLHPSGHPDGDPSIEEIHRLNKEGEYLWKDYRQLKIDPSPDLRVMNLESHITRTINNPDLPTWKGIRYHTHADNLDAMLRPYAETTHGGAVASPVVVSLANNHIMDYGRKSFDSETLPALEKLESSLPNVRPIGSGRNSFDASKPAVFDCVGKNVEVFAVSSGCSGTPSSWWATEQRSGVIGIPSLVDADAVDQAVEITQRAIGAHSSSSDDSIRILSVHMGPNWALKGEDEDDIACRREYAHRVIDSCGIDLIYGHSSHHARGMEVYKGKLILYGTGDIINDYEGFENRGEERYNTLGGIYLVDIDSESGDFAQLTIIPMYMNRLRLERYRKGSKMWRPRERRLVVVDSKAKEMAAFINSLSELDAGGKKSALEVNYIDEGDASDGPLLADLRWTSGLSAGVKRFPLGPSSQLATMEAIPTSPAPEAVLRDAQLLNSDLGRHSVRCKFSSRLAGRFYENGSLERHSLRKSRLVEMQAKKRKLERELQLEERRVELLEERLSETEKAREDALEIIFTIERGVTRFQAFVRRKQALRLFRAMRHEAQMREFAARFLQRRHRGWKGRLRAESRRQHLRKKRRFASAAYIQASVRRHTQRRIYLNLLAERERRSNRSAASIQAILRGKAARMRYLAERRRRQAAAVHTQRVWRGRWGRMEFERLRQELLRRRLEAAKPKRIPLHQRKYSTYGASPQRKPNNATAKKRDARMRRRSSDAMITLKDGRLLSTLSNFKASASTGDPGDENDSLASTITSLDASRRSNAPSWPSPQRVLESKQRGGIPRRHTTLQSPEKVGGTRRSSLERRRTMACLSTPLISQRPPRERQSTLQACSDADSSNGSTRERQKVGDSTEVAQQRDKADPSSPQRQNSEASKPDESATEQNNVPATITLSEEAALIVAEVLGKGITTHSILHSTFEDERGECEDDLEGL
ncbi:hypothetical protein ACHAXT_009260 [Thalassiosira profunda]